MLKLWHYPLDLGAGDNFFTQVVVWRFGEFFSLINEMFNLNITYQSDIRIYLTIYLSGGKAQTEENYKGEILL